MFDKPTACALRGGFGEIRPQAASPAFFCKNSHFMGGRNDKVLYYDCSNYYFEIEQEEGSKRYGKSKDHRPNPIIQMGLFMDGDGILLAFSLFPGNANEQTSLKPLEQKVLHEFAARPFQ